MRDVETFIVRIWAGVSDSPPDDDVRGVVRHVGSGLEQRFEGFVELGHFLRSTINPVVHDEVARTDGGDRGH